MATPSRPAPGTQWARIVVYGTADVKEFSNDFWYSISAGSLVPPYAYATALLAIYTELTTPWILALSNTITLRGAYGEFNDGAGTATTNIYVSQLGVLSPEPVPEDVAVVVRKQTANLTPSGKGRWYFAGTPNTGVIGSYLTGGQLTLWQALAVAAKTAVTSGGVTFAPAHFSRKTRLLYPITDDPVVALLGTRRRRRGPF